MSSAYIVEVVDESKVSAETGEILLSTTTKKKKLPREPDFVKAYTADVASLARLTHIELVVLQEVTKYINYKNEVTLSSIIRNRMVQGNISIKTLPQLARALKGITEKNVMVKLGVNSYIMNPDYFAKGHWAEVWKLRNRFMNLNIRYSKNGRVISARIESQHKAMKQEESR